jgi:hypothetical protein
MPSAGKTNSLDDNMEIKNTISFGDSKFKDGSAKKEKKKQVEMLRPTSTDRMTLLSI